MPASTEEVIFVIIAVIVVLLFVGVLFLVSLAHYANKRKQMRQEKEAVLVEAEKQLLQSRVEMQEQTFNFISQEIHDNVGQILSVAKVQLSLLEEGGTFDRTLIGQTKESLSKAMAELRDLARSLSSERIRAFDLLQSIEEEVYRINKTGAVRVVFGKEGNIRIKDEHKLLLFRVVQESLQNTVKHAGASLVEIYVTGNDNDVRIVIQDNGVGFRFDELEKEGRGLGLKNMEQRMALIGGLLHIGSKEGEGTTVAIQLNSEP